MTSIIHTTAALTWTVLMLATGAAVGWYLAITSMGAC